MSAFDGLEPLGSYSPFNYRLRERSIAPSDAAMRSLEKRTAEAQISKNQARKEARKACFRDYTEWMVGKLVGDCTQCGRRRKVGWAGRCFRCGG